MARREFFEKLTQKVRGAANEEELRASFCFVAESELGLDDLRLERKRQDLRRNRVIIEFKRPGLFCGKENSLSFVQAQSQLATNYIPNQALEDGRRVSDYTGVCFDGHYLAYITLDDQENVAASKLIPFNRNSADHLVHVLVSDSQIELTPENIENDFGTGSRVATDLLSSLFKDLSDKISRPDSRTRMLYEEWVEIFLQCTSLSAVSQQKLQKDLEGCALHSAAKHTHILFVLHTYHAFIFKILAAEIALNNTLIEGIQRGYCAEALARNDEELVKSLENEIESSGLFRQVNLLNFIEGAFFSWYLDDPSDSLLEAIRSAISQIDLYRLRDLKLGRTRDVIKRIYQQIIPKALRHDLGEFFTPEWLVEYTLDTMGYCGQGILTEKFLDPCCGSGNFLIHAIDRYKNEARLLGWSDDQILDGITHHIYGFDLNPLAVLSTRINYLIAISDLIKTHSDVEIPCYQADAIYSPSSSQNEESSRVYTVATRKRSIDLLLPESLVQNTKLLGRVLEKMETGIVRGQPFAIFLTLMRAEEAYATSHDSESWTEPLASLYAQLEELERSSWNRIWCRIIRNFFASVAIGECKYIGGNPPWIMWANLPEDYRARISPTCKEYAIFSQDRYFGGNELDISAVITYSVAKKWLAPGGKLGFVLTQSHFQSQSSEGFRRFNVQDVPLKVLSVDDFSKVKPFLTAVNKPTILVLQKGEETIYPLPYFVWEKNQSKQIDENLRFSDVQRLLRKEQFEATPLNGVGGRWCILPPGRFGALSSLEGRDSYHVGRKGVTTDLNAVFFVKPIGLGRTDGTLQCKSTPLSGKKSVPEVVGEIEIDLLYPLIKGAGDVRRFYATTSELYIIIPNKKITRSDIPLASNFASSNPKAFEYFERLGGGRGDSLLNQRATWRRSMRKTYEKLAESGKIPLHDIPYYAVDNVGDYTFSPYKVVWAEISKTLQAAVVSSADMPFNLGKKVIVPEHKIYFTPFDSENEAHYLCALLNSKPISEFVDGFTVKLQVGTLFRHFSLPRFDAQNADHNKLVGLSLAAHAEAKKGGGPVEQSGYLDSINDVVNNMLKFADRLNRVNGRGNG